LIDSIPNANYTDFLKIEKGSILVQNSFGFIMNCPTFFKLGNIEQISSIILASILLNNHLIGMTGNISSTDINDYNNKVSLLKQLFFSLQKTNPSL
jgi:hypothetical protein